MTRITIALVAYELWQRFGWRLAKRVFRRIVDGDLPREL
jgi:hypothetical protein